MNYQKYVKDLFSNACLASCYSYLAWKCFNWITMTEDIINGVRKGYINSDGYVEDPIGYLRSMGFKAQDIEKVYISDLEQLPDNKDYVVEYKKSPTAKESHFVVARDKKVFFDPSEPSQTVKVGAPYSYRKIIM